jgi:hypothetical protein
MQDGEYYAVKSIMYTLHIPLLEDIEYMEKIGNAVF